jgi:hypothetical protein
LAFFTLHGGATIVVVGRLRVNITGHIGTKSIQILAYADDVAIVGRNKNALKDTLVNTEREARKRGL